MERVIDRFDKYMVTKNLNDNKVTRQLGLSTGLLGKSRKKGTDLSKKNVEKILNFYTDLNNVWLLTGQDKMLKTEKTSNFKDIETTPTTHPDQSERIARLEFELKFHKELLADKERIIELLEHKAERLFDGVVKNPQTIKEPLELQFILDKQFSHYLDIKNQYLNADKEKVAKAVFRSNDLKQFCNIIGERNVSFSLSNVRDIWTAKATKKGKELQKIKFIVYPEIAGYYSGQITKKVEAIFNFAKKQGCDIVYFEGFPGRHEEEYEQIDLDNAYDKMQGYAKEVKFLTIAELMTQTIYWEDEEVPPKMQKISREIVTY